MSTDPSSTDAAQRWWREPEVVGLIALVVVAYCLRAADLPLRGEEPTRAQIAFEMVYWNDWLIPRIQGEAFRIRPPLQNWVNAGCCVLLDSWDVYAIRLPSLIATLLTTIMIYAYGRICLGRLGAFSAAAAFATMADMFKMGLYNETEPLFILLLSASLLVWHAGLLRNWPDWLTYSAGYGLMALATLTKGIQAPPYFIGGITLYLACTRQWRRLFCPGHLVGIAVGALVLLAWVLPYGLAMGWPAAKEVWLGDQSVQNGRRVVDWPVTETVIHLFTYPLEVIAASLPWCLLLLPYLTASFRRALGAARPQVVFLTVCMAVAGPTCWVPPTGLPRYFAPLFPCMAVLIGVVVERCADARALPSLRTAWQRYNVTLACVMIASGLGVVVLSTGLGAMHPLLAPLAEPLPIALAYGVTALGLAALILRSRAGATPLQVRLAVLAVVAFLVITFTGVVTDVRVRRSVDSAAAVDEIKTKLPPGQHLVSLNGQVDSLFTYLYRLPIVTPRRVAPFGTEPADDVSFFCFSSPGDSRPKLPFAWEEIGVVNLDRNTQPVPERVIVVGRRLPAGTSVPAVTVSRQ